ncbi:MAG: hypothetical protein ACO3BD_01105 [Chitinophagaceae bacterium]
MKFIYYLCAISTMMILSCNSTRLTSSWKDPSFNVPTYQHIGVAGILQGVNKRSLREFMEQHVAEDLIKMGYRASSISDMYGPQLLKGMKEDEAVKMLREKGYDAVMTLAVIDIEQMRDYVSGGIGYQPSAIYYHRFGWYYGYWFDRIYMPGYYVTNTRYLVEANLYDIASDKLVYSAQSETFNPSSIDDLGHTMSIRILKDMKTKGVLR